MKVYSPGDMADLLQLKVSTIRKYSIMLEELGYEFQKNSRQQRYYTDNDVMTLRKLVTLKNNGMTLNESAEGVILWHNGNETEQQDITLYQANTHNITQHDNSDIQEVKKMIQKQNELIGELSDRLNQQREYINQRLNEHDKMLMQTMNEIQESKKQIAAFEDQPDPKEKTSFWSKLFGK